MFAFAIMISNVYSQNILFKCKKYGADNYVNLTINLSQKKASTLNFKWEVVSQTEQFITLRTSNNFSSGGIYRVVDKSNEEFIDSWSGITFNNEKKIWELDANIEKGKCTRE